MEQRGRFKAVRRLLANHGVLVFHRTPAQAVQIGSIVEETAPDAITAIALGGPQAIEREMRAAALQAGGRLRRDGHDRRLRLRGNG